MNPFFILLGFLLILKVHSKCGVPQKCQCPVISNANDGRLGEIESTKYLSHRKTFSAGITVSDDCKVTVDISESTANNFFLLFVRDPEPPIFFRRFTNTTDKNKRVQLPELHCVNDGSTYNWYHNEVKISGKFEVTLLDNEECGCEPIEPFILNATITQIDGTCDAFHIKCDKDLISYGGSSALIFPSVAEATLAEFLCVDKNWYYGSFEMNTLAIGCVGTDFNSIAPIPDRPRMEKFVEKCPCTYKVQSLNFTEDYSKDYWWPATIEYYNISKEYHNLTQNAGSFVYDETACSLEMNCPEGATLIIWSRNYKPMIFPPSKASATAQCANMPASSALAGEKVMDYWINGIQLIDFTYGCFYMNS